MSKTGAAITIYADFDECETRGIKLGNKMMEYCAGDILRLDIMQEAICDLTEMYNEELARFPGDAVLSKAKEISCK